MSWEKVQLKKVAKIGAGQSAPKDSDFSSNDGLPFIRAGHLEKLIECDSISELPTVNVANAQKNRLKAIKKGSILFAKSGMSAMMNRVYLVDQDTYYVSHLASVTPDNLILDSKFCFYFLKYFKTSKLIKDSAYPSIGLPDIENLLIPLPPLATQKLIAEILDAADALKRKDQQLLKKYDELAQAIFIDMFGDPVKNEKGWEVKKLKEILEVDAKSVNPTTLKEYNYIGLEHIEKETGKILVIEKGKVVSNKFIFSDVHILYGKLRPYLNKVATPSFNGICSTDIFPLKPRNSLMKDFIVAILRSKDFVNHSDTNAVGANLPRANKEIILSYETIVPDIDTVQKFSSFTSSLKNQQYKVDDNLLKSELLFQTLIQKAFNGELVN